MKRLIAVGLLGLTACTPAQTAAWLDWHAQDPDGAQAWLASPEGQESLDDEEPQASTEPLTNAHGSRWDRIARCESGGNWSYPPVTNRTGTYSGGLMIGHRWWGPNGGKQYAEWPYLATKAEQIAVAEVILSKNGWGAWDCS